MYLARLVDVFHEVKRVLKSDGTLWVVVGDSYCGSGKGRKANGEPSKFVGFQTSNRGSVVGKLRKPNCTNCK